MNLYLRNVITEGPDAGYGDKPVKSFYDDFVGVVIIHFEWWVGKGHGIRYKGKTTWTAFKDGVTLDYHQKHMLIKMCQDDGLKYVVLRHHKKKPGYTVMESNYQYKKQTNVK